MKIICAVCDDEEDVRVYMRKILMKEFILHGYNPEIYFFDSPEALLRDMSVRTFQIIFMDIEFSDGRKKIKVMEQIIELSGEKPLFLIYVSNHDELVFDTFKYRPFWFVRKSRLKVEIGSIIKELCKCFDEKKEEQILIEKDGRIIPIKVCEILYIESFGKEQVIHKLNSKYTVFLKMGEIEKKLQTKGFIRVHRSYLVNCHYIKELGNEDAILINGDKIPISRYRKKEIREKYKDYILNLI